VLVDRLGHALGKPGTISPPSEMPMNHIGKDIGTAGARARLQGRRRLALPQRKRRFAQNR
jgi:hypothetical protein